VPRSQFNYLHAQDCLFTYMEGADFHFLKHGEWPRLEHTVCPDTLVKVTLPVSERLELRRLLWIERVSKAHMMPTLDNVTQTLREYWAEIAADRERKDLAGPSSG